jgi:hypothetical protein
VEQTKQEFLHRTELLRHLDLPCLTALWA